MAANKLKKTRGRRQFAAPRAAGAKRSIGEELRDAQQNRESPIPLDVRVKASEALDKIKHFTTEHKKAAKMRRGEGPIDPSVQVLSTLVYSARDDDFRITVEAEDYVLPAGKTTKVPGNVAQFIGYGNNPGFPGLRVVVGDKTDANIKRDARETYMRWVGKFVSDTLRARAVRVAPTRKAGLPSPIPNPDEAHAMVLAKRYEGQLTF
jgi:hypothetical protein